ncbi:hypothetical protein DWY47_03485 [Ruminococcus sp. AF25-23LB]|nr:hypothetical protein DWY47_03485 [Ruminococcus sp. AF25-23LB]
MPFLSDTRAKCRIGTAKFFTLLLLLYRTSVKSQGIKQLMAGGGVVLIGTQLVPLLANLF